MNDFDDMRKVNELKAGVILSYVNMAISTAIPLLYTPIMLRILGQAEYGLYSLSNSVISYLSLLTFGLGGAILRYLTKSRTEGNKAELEKVLGLFVVLYALIALISVAAGVTLTHFTGAFFAKGLTELENERLNVLIVIMAINAAISLLCVPFSSITICYERYVFRRIVEILSTIATPIFNLVVLYAGYASVGMAIVGTAIQLVFLLINIAFCNSNLKIHPRFKNLPFYLLKDIFKFTAFVFISTIADLLYWSTDKVLLGAMVSSSAVAVYNIGATFNGILQNMSSAISGVFAPRVNQFVFAKHDINDFSALMIRVGRIQYLIVSLVLSGFVVFGRSFILLWAGTGYEAAYDVALLTMIPLAIPLIQNIAFTTITAQNRHQFRSVIYVILAVLNVFGTYLLIPRYGIIGAALCTCAVFLVGHGLTMNWFYYKKIGLDIPAFWRNILKMSIVPVGMTLIAMFLRNYLNVKLSMLNLLTEICIYTAVFCVLSWILSMNTYEKSLITGTVKKGVRKEGC